MGFIWPGFGPGGWEMGRIFNFRFQIFYKSQNCKFRIQDFLLNTVLKPDDCFHLAKFLGQNVENFPFWSKFFISEFEKIIEKSSFSQIQLSPKGATFLTRHNVRHLWWVLFGKNFKSKSPKIADLWQVFDLREVWIWEVGIRFCQIFNL